ncbi:extracellular solute-binding protein [Pseudoclostridium thermosuccinogenes]|uniref:extracellular solute-binding protein n=1 Tax=Clostridium thermosuccinogenes TaxID=84032 RepID=UPI002FD8952A
MTAKKSLRFPIRLLASFVVFVLCIPLLAGLTNAAELDSIRSEIPDLEKLYLSLPGIPENDYYIYKRKYEDKKYKGEVITYPIEKLVSGRQLENGGILIPYNETVELKLDVSQEGTYLIGFYYCTADDNILPSGISMKVNGEYPFPEMQRLSVSDTWVVEREGFQLDRYGNEVVPMPVKRHEWKHTYLYGEDRLYSTPMSVYLQEGTNTLTMTCTEGDLIIGDITLSPEKQLDGYTAAGKPDGDNIIVIEAEHMDRRNSPNIRPDSIFDTNLTPYSSTKKILNTVADYSFKAGGNRIEYDFEIEEEGYYYIGFNYRQSTKANFPVFRNIYIDGEIPYKEFQSMAFPYSTKYTRLVAATEEGEKMAVYLDKGKHTIAIEVSLDNVRDAIKILTRVVNEMNDMALDIGKITGGNTEKFRDFVLEDFDFDIESKLNQWTEIILDVYDALAVYNPGVKNIGELSSLKVAARTLQQLAKEPNDLPKKLDAFSQGPSSARQSLTTMIELLNQSPLGLDKIFIFQDEHQLPKPMGFFEKIVENVKRFFYSFKQQEYAPTYDANSENLQVWVSRPRQYLEIIQRMADTDFKEKYGINVDLSIMPDQNKLILSNASGKSPDIAMSIASGITYDLAVRGVLADMRQFDNFKEVARRFAPGMLIPGVSENGLYAIPETFNFWVLYYRKDILNSMGLEVPDTMEEVRQMLPQLQRRGLNFNSHVSNFIGSKPFAATIPFIYQNGGRLFDEDTMKSSLDSKEVLNGMTMLTENYTIYNMPYEVQSFYQSFRDGRIPIGISDYGMFNLLTNAAPEIKGLWDVAPYPGVKDENGEVQRWTLGSAESCVIFESSDKKEEAWKVLDWWTSTEVQTEFAYTLQSTLGNEYLWNSSNLEAMKNTPWIRKHEAILEQVQWTREPPRILGGYMIERELSNVITSVVMEGENVRSAMDEAIKRINREINRKLEEFGYIVNGEVVKPFVVPDIDTVREWVE